MDYSDVFAKVAQASSYQEALTALGGAGHESLFGLFSATLLNRPPNDVVLPIAYLAAKRIDEIHPEEDALLAVAMSVLPVDERSDEKKIEETIARLDDQYEDLTLEEAVERSQSPLRELSKEALDQFQRDLEQIPEDREQAFMEAWLKAYLPPNMEESGGQLTIGRHFPDPKVIRAQVMGEEAIQEPQESKAPLSTSSTGWIGRVLSILQRLGAIKSFFFNSEKQGIQTLFTDSFFVVGNDSVEGLLTQIRFPKEVDSVKGHLERLSNEEEKKAFLNRLITKQYQLSDVDFRRLAEQLVEVPDNLRDPFVEKWVHLRNVLGEAPGVGDVLSQFPEYMKAQEAVANMSVLGYVSSLVDRMPSDYQSILAPVISAAVQAKKWDRDVYQQWIFPEIDGQRISAETAVALIGVMDQQDFLEKIVVAVAGLDAKLRDQVLLKAATGQKAGTFDVDRFSDFIATPIQEGRLALSREALLALVGQAKEERFSLMIRGASLVKEEAVDGMIETMKQAPTEEKAIELLKLLESDRLIQEMKIREEFRKALSTGQNFITVENLSRLFRVSEDRVEEVLEKLIQEKVLSACVFDEDSGFYALISYDPLINEYLERIQDSSERAKEIVRIAKNPIRKEFAGFQQSVLQELAAMPRPVYTSKELAGELRCNEEELSSILDLASSQGVIEGYSYDYDTKVYTLVLGRGTDSGSDRE